MVSSASNYRFIEEPRRNVAWESHFQEPYIRLFGYTREPSLDQYGKPTKYFRDRNPMQVVGIQKPSARYGYTWRGIKRLRDREHGIAGGELLIYDIQTNEVLAVQRQFLISLGDPRTGDKAVWEIAAPCPQVPSSPGVADFREFAWNILNPMPSPKLEKRIWEVLAQEPNTSTGFSGTLFKNRATGELVMSFRSTEFVDDAARDNQATNVLEIKEFGFAFGQIRDMEAWYQKLVDGGKLPPDAKFSVTGYSLGGHLATAFSFHREAAGWSADLNPNLTCMAPIQAGIGPELSSHGRAM